MTDTLTDGGGTMYRIESGGKTRRVYGARRRIEQHAHTLVVQTMSDVSKTLDLEQREWAYDLRRGRRSIFGGSLRFITEMHRRGVPKETAMMIPEWIADFIQALYDGRPAADAVDAESQRVA